ncbi:MULTISPECIES: potassium channel family protein [unclassified Streptomyces]|uniref:potassium channel family protein n=1 Tax=unclassified Streptomyces TaxID=2593676 RepID=UPI0035DD53CE
MDGPVDDRAGPDPPTGSVPRRRRATAVALARAAAVTTGLFAAYYLLPLDERPSAATWAAFVCGLVAVVLVFLWEIRAILRSPHPRLRAAEALAATAVLFLVLFAAFYYLLERASPGTFSEALTKTDSLYFTLTTFATVGYGDIVARSQTGRLVVMIQMAGGLLLVGVAARVLVGAVQTGLRRQGRETPPD